MNNLIKTILLFSALSFIFIVLGGLVAGRQGVYFAFIISLLINGISYFWSDKIALVSSGAKLLPKKGNEKIYKIVGKLAEKMSLPMPSLYKIPTDQANAFATGRSPEHASLALTSGLLNILNVKEIEAVISHELSHVKNRDILIVTVAAVMASAISFLANMQFYGGFARRDERSSENSGILGLVFVIFMPVAAMFIQLAVSRQREFGADASGAKVLGSGEPLARALVNINNSIKEKPLKSVNPALSSLYISNPTGNLLKTLFSTHPPLEERIKRLRTLKI